MKMATKEIKIRRQSNTVQVVADEKSTTESYADASEAISVISQIEFALKNMGVKYKGNGPEEIIETRVWEK